MKNFKLMHFPHDLDLARAVARDWLELVSERPGNGFLAALSGGRIAPLLFGEVVAEVKRRRTSLENVEFFWADERCVASDSLESNFVIANKVLLLPLGVPRERIHRLRGELEPGIAVAQANEELGRVAANVDHSLPVFDLILLGMGEDGHVASLFPNTPARVVRSRSAYVFVENAPKPPPRRVTLSYAAITVAREVWVLVSGPGKQKALKRSIETGNTPLGMVLRARGGTRIYGLCEECET